MNYRRIILKLFAICLLIPILMYILCPSAVIQRRILTEFSLHQKVLVLEDWSFFPGEAKINMNLTQISGMSKPWEGRFLYIKTIHPTYDFSDFPNSFYYHYIFVLPNNRLALSSSGGVLNYSTGGVERHIELREIIW